MRRVWTWSWLLLAGCGSTPAPTEVTEPWTSGDEVALGIEEPAAPAEPPASEAEAPTLTAPPSPGHEAPR
jgi:hypothetical protein